MKAIDYLKVLHSDLLKWHYIGMRSHLTYFYLNGL